MVVDPKVDLAVEDHFANIEVGRHMLVVDRAVEHMEAVGYIVVEDTVVIVVHKPAVGTVVDRWHTEVVGMA